MGDLTEADYALLDEALNKAEPNIHGTAEALVFGVKAIVARHRAEAAREALLSAADAPWRPDHAAGHNWLRDRATQIGGA